MGVHREQGEPGVVGLADGAPGTVLVDVTDFELLEVAAEGFAVALRGNLLEVLDHGSVLG